jgi:phosphatidylglycerol---prolipoprotein diacylglyceryl transferase
MQPTLDLGPITLQTFGIAFALAFVAAGAVAARRLKELGRPVEWAYEMILCAFVGGVVGARVYYVAADYDAVKHDFIGHLFSGSGLVWYGGAIGGAIAVVIWAYRRRMLNLQLLDLAAVPLAVGYTVGRIGCQVSGDGDYGRAWDGPWAMAYPHGTVPTHTAVQPTPIYETLAMGLIAYALWRLRDRFRPGILFALYLVLSGVERFLVELLRRNPADVLGITQPQFISVIAVVAGLACIAVAARRGQILRQPGAARPAA